MDVVLHAQIQDFFQGGGGSTARKQSGQRYFSTQLILQVKEGVQWFYNRELRENYTFEGSRGGLTFSKRGPTFSGGGGGGEGGPSACLVVNPITVGNFAFLFNCTSVGRTSDSITVPT